MEHKIRTIKELVIEAAKSSEFVHNKWFVDWHLHIVEKIALELCALYPEADKDVVTVLVWLHDYGKIINFDRQHEDNCQLGRQLLEDNEFDELFIQKIVDYIKQIDSHRTLDLTQAPIEVQIISSADACSHMVGPFYPLYWYENPDKEIKELMDSNKKKMIRDREGKTVLPEAKIFFENRYKYLLEQTGSLPDKFFS